MAVGGGQQVEVEYLRISVTVLSAEWGPGAEEEA